jgi:hypothetical protein
MLKLRTSLLEADRRNDQTVLDATGELRPMQIEDLHDLMLKLELGPGVPPAIREHFDVARNAFIYSWFSYELVSLAEAHSYTVLEAALRHRIEAAGGDVSGARGLQNLYEKAVSLKYLNTKDFEVPSPFSSGGTISLFEFVRLLRNDVMHGHSHLLPDGSLQMMRLCAEILGRLFADPNCAGRAVKERIEL